MSPGQLPDPAANHGRPQISHHSRSVSVCALSTHVSQLNEGSRLKSNNKVKDRRAHSSSGAGSWGTDEPCQTLYIWVREVYVHALPPHTDSSLYHGWDPHETHTQIQAPLAVAEPGPSGLASVNKTRQHANLS